MFLLLFIYFFFLQLQPLQDCVPRFPPRSPSFTVIYAFLDMYMCLNDFTLSVLSEAAWAVVSGSLWVTPWIWIALFYCSDGCKEELFFLYKLYWKIEVECGIFARFPEQTPDCIVSPKEVPLVGQQVVVFPKRLLSNFKLMFEKTCIRRDENPWFLFW